MILRKKNRAGGIMFLEFRLYLQTDSQQSENKVAQLCPTLCDPTNCRLPGSPVHGIFQARILKWVAISFSRRSSWPRDWTWVSYIVGRWLYCLSHQGSGMMMAQNRNTDQQNRIEDPEINQFTYSQLFYNKGGKNIEWRSLFNKWCWDKWIVTWKRMKLQHSLTPHTKINSKRIKHLNARPDTIKFIVENKCKTLTWMSAKFFWIYLLEWW